MNFIKQNWFKICLLSIILIIIAIVGYFYNKQLSLEYEKQNIAVQERQNELWQKCHEDGPKYVSDLFSSLNGTGVTKEWFAYSTDLNTCLADITDVRYAASPTNRVTYAIYDIYSDKELAFYSLNLVTEQVTAGNRSNFDILEKKYFSN